MRRMKSFGAPGFGFALAMCALLLLLHAGRTLAAASDAAGGGDQSSQVLPQLQEVIVTAEKRAQPLVAVPQSITALPEATLTTLNIQSFKDYAVKVPNLTFNEGGNGGPPGDANRITIRGVVGAYTTSMYIDDTPIPETENPRVVDVQRIEVLKGPQGTLYGSAGIGGTIRIITNQPSLTQDESRYMLQAGETEHAGSPDFGATGIANMVAIPNTLGVRLMGFLNHDGGFVTRTFPTTDGSDVRSSEGNTGEEYEYGASLAATWKLTDNFQANFKLLAQRQSYPTGLPTVYRGLPQVEPTTLTVNRDYNVPEYSLDDWDLPALTLTYTRPTWNIVSSTSVFRQNTADVLDVSEAEHELFNSPGYDFYDGFGSMRSPGDGSTLNFNEEDRLNWTPTKNFDALLGVYYEHDLTNGNGNARIFPGVVGLTWPNTGLVMTDVYFATSSRNTFEQRAVYANVDYTFLKIITATAGVRKYHIDQIVRTNTVGFIVNYETPRYTRQYLSHAGYSPRFVLSAQPDAATNVYASAARGFRRGGGAGYVISIQCYPELAAIGISPQQLVNGYAPDTVWTYELGGKKTLFSQRVLATAAFYDTEWQDIQQNVTLGSCGQHFTTNAGAARIRGFELEFSGNVTPSLDMRAGYGYTDGRITDSAHGTTTQPVGARVYGVPEANASLSATYHHTLSSSLNGFVSADWSYTGSWASPNNSQTSPAVVEPYELVNFRIGLDSSQNEYSLYLNNVTNRLAALGDQIPPIDQTTILNGKKIPYERMYVTTPRTIGIQVRHGF